MSAAKEAQRKADDETKRRIQAWKQQQQEQEVSFSRAVLYSSRPSVHPSIRPSIHPPQQITIHHQFGCIILEGYDGIWRFSILNQQYTCMKLTLSHSTVASEVNAFFSTLLKLKLKLKLILHLKTKLNMNLKLET